MKYFRVWDYWLKKKSFFAGYVKGEAWQRWISAFPVERPSLTQTHSASSTVIMASLKTCTFFESGTHAQFEFLLTKYEEALVAKAHSKSSKPETLIKLDKWWVLQCVCWCVIALQARALSCSPAPLSNLYWIKLFCDFSVSLSADFLVQPGGLLIALVMQYPRGHLERTYRDGGRREGGSFVRADVTRQASSHHQLAFIILLPGSVVFM